VAAFTCIDEQFRRELDAERMRRRGGGKDWHPGCTAVAALVIDGRLVVANAGDCRVVLCRKGKAVQITKVGAVSLLQKSGFRCCRCIVF
jgi:serine/threonine protein phosphatase PrpC